MPAAEAPASSGKKCEAEIPPCLAPDLNTSVLQLMYELTCAETRRSFAT